MQFGVLSLANLDRQKRYLALLRQAVSVDGVRASSLAALEDEIALAEDGKQIYGTEIAIIDGRAVIPSVVDPARLDERRAFVGLPPMSEYLRHAESELGMPVDRSALNVR
jgi:uncharacterized protein involved in exopolysaccharide biosynthesis